MDTADRAGPEQENTYLFEQSLSHVDPEISQLIELEDERQLRKIILVASESIAPMAVRQALGTSFSNIYAEGYSSTRMIRSLEKPISDFDHHLSFFRRYYDRRYYKGCDYVNFVEALCQQRAAALFATDRFNGSGPKVKAEEIFVNVQALSGAAANNAVYEAFLKPGDTVLGMSLDSGGHLTHGSPVNRSGKRYNIVSYTAGTATGKLDFSEIRKLALEHKPKMIIGGYSAYPWAVDWGAFKEIADELGNECVLLADISHPAGLVVAGRFPSPIGIADVTMTTTHKTLCGPRGAILLATDREKAQAIDMAVFPGEQGGAHFNTILAKAVAFNLAMTDDFQEMQRKIKENASYLCEALAEKGLKPAYGGTESHMFLLDLTSLKGPYNYSLRGEVASRTLDLCGITLNKNTIAGDTNAAHPSAIRIGTTWITQRGFGKSELDRLAELIQKVLSSSVPFHYIGPAASLGRARIDYKVMEEVKSGVEELLKGVDPKFPEGHPLYPHYSMPKARRFGSALASELKETGAKMIESDDRMLPDAFEGSEAEQVFAKENAALAEISQMPLFEVGGERAENFLNDVVTIDVYAMKEGECREAFMLDKDGRQLCHLYLLKIGTDKAGGFDRFRLSINSDEGYKILSWLRGLSDGYILLDKNDIFKKAEGPVVISSLRTSLPEERRVRLAVIGPKAKELLGDIIPEANSLDVDSFAFVDCGGTSILLSRPNNLFHTGGFEIQLHPRQAPGLWKTILEKGRSRIRPIGRAALSEIMGCNGADGEPIEASVLIERSPECFDLTKPFFIGRDSLPGAEPRTPYEYTPEILPLRKTPLFEEHIKLGAGKFLVPFAGWKMPVWYTRVSDEHMAVRTTAGLFDVAHMGVLDVRGPSAARFLNMVATNYVVRMFDGQAQYNYLLYPDGKVIDDIMIYRLAWDNYQVVCNAVNAEKVIHWLNAVNSGEIMIDMENPGARIEGRPAIRNLKDKSSGEEMRVDIALQGPNSRGILQAMCDNNEDRKALVNLQKSYLMKAELCGIPVIISRTGYTGEELGYELFVHPNSASAFWNSALEHGKAFGIKPTGLGARDSTRTEAGFPLYGHELAGEFDVDPIEAGYGSFVKFHKPFFIGRKALLERWLKPRKKTVVRFRITTKRPRNIRPGDPVVDRGGRYVGNVTSCALINGRLKGLALVDSRMSSNKSKIAIFPLPPGDRATPAVELEKMKKGDRLVVNERAVVIPRFPLR